MAEFYQRFKQEEAGKNAYLLLFKPLIDGTEISGTIDSISNDNASKEEKQTAVDKSLAGISQLSHEVRDTASTLPKHDLQTYTKV